MPESSHAHDGPAADFRRTLERLKAGGGGEFAEGASEWPPGLDRREFLKILGASLALGGLSGCMRRSEGKIVPYVIPPEDALPGIPEFYATAMPVEGFARGILVESNLGRPTKIEGNPDHPESLGATDAVTQAAILSLYDPERSRAPMHKAAPASWEAFGEDWAPHRADFLASGGTGMALLTEPTTSPSLLREIGRFLQTFPQARWYQHTPLSGYEVDGLQPDYDLGAPKVILSIGSDCLFRHPACIRYARAFARSRRVEGGRSTPSRFYAIEASPSVTGVLADNRLPASPERMRLIFDAVADAMDGSFAPLPALSAGEANFVAALVRDLRANSPHVVCIAGQEQDIEVQRWALAMNARLGADGGAARSIASVRSDSDSRCAGNIQRLSESLAAGEIGALVILGSNPAYTSAAFRQVGGLVGKLPFSLHLGEYADETAGLCTWHLPEAHFLETWGDLRAYDGTATVLQPLIEPLFGGKSALEILRMLAGGGAAGGYEIIRETWTGEREGPDFEAKWSEWLRRGTIDPPMARPPSRASARAPEVPRLSKAGGAQGRWLVIVPDASVLDGRWSNNAWLQELPRPLTHLVWDNAALISPALAESLHASTGDLLLLECGASSVEAAAYVLPGHADGCVTLSLGYGRTRAGSIGNGCGFDAYRLRAGAAWVIPGLRVTATGRTYPLVSTHHHFSMEGRDIVRVVEPDALHVQPNGDNPSLYRQWKTGENAWGMSIDLSTCLGCNACVAACQAENNIPTVGKDQASRGREMHWIRIDQYLDGDPANPRVLSQPVLCMHCENAPCELVCPVGATVHSSEGLNEMVYNRCVGTRYCSNNCPYKVRRFNFLDYRSKKDSTVNLQKNPDVTVRERGVMEKCTYCVQRINAARITAEKENRPVRDGEIRTACQQACPAEAIVFGNIADPGSLVSRRKAEPTNYSLLGELNTRPRTTYLAKVRNPGPAPSV
jgi:molybdopterin-containing oxidoreductase family iron-sulfur binding subunit